MRLVFVASATVALLAVSVAGSAVRPSPAALIAKGIARADLTPLEKAEYAVVLARARAELGRLPRARADLLRKVVADVAAQWRSYTSRAPARSSRRSASTSAGSPGTQSRGATPT